MKKLSIVTGRAEIPTGTTSTNPVELDLNPNAPNVKSIHLYCTHGAASLVSHVYGDSGWRMKNNGVILIPGNGSNDSGISIINGDEAGWGGIVFDAPIDLNLGDGLALDGPPYKVKFQFYNNNATDFSAFVILVCGDFEPTLQDIVKEMRFEREKIERLINAHTGNNPA